jgi:hypothetical protein
MLLFLACAPEPAATPDAAEPRQSTGYAGRTVFSYTSDGTDPKVVEVDEKGVVTWEFHVRDLVGGESGSLDVVPAVNDVQPLRGGNLLLAVTGYGLYEIDRDGKVVWQHADELASHDVDRLPNGNTLYTRAWAPQGEAAVIEVDSRGTPVWTWSGVQAYAGDPRFDGYTDEGGAWLHPTSVQRLADGRTSICIRNFNRVVLVSPAGELVREVKFQSPETTIGLVTDGNLQGQRPHAAEWTPGEGLLIALRSPDRALHVKEGEVLRDVRAPNLTGITDVDTLPNGGLLIASHSLLEELDANGAVVWSWQEEAESVDDDAARVKHVFRTVARTDAEGAALDHD